MHKGYLSVQVSVETLSLSLSDISFCIRGILGTSHLLKHFLIFIYNIAYLRGILDTSTPVETFSYLYHNMRYA